LTILSGIGECSLYKGQTVNISGFVDLMWSLKSSNGLLSPSQSQSHKFDKKLLEIMSSLTLATKEILVREKACDSMGCT
jgi:hypothetical protein